MKPVPDPHGTSVQPVWEPPDERRDNVVKVPQLLHKVRRALQDLLANDGSDGSIGHVTEEKVVDANGRPLTNGELFDALGEEALEVVGQDVGLVGAGQGLVQNGLQAVQMSFLLRRALVSWCWCLETARLVAHDPSVVLGSGLPDVADDERRELVCCDRRAWLEHGLHMTGARDDVDFLWSDVEADDTLVVQCFP